MAICDWCGIREAGLVAVARDPKNRRPHLFLCPRCWDDKWSHDDYDAGRMPFLTAMPSAIKNRVPEPFHLPGRALMDPRPDSQGEHLHC